MRARGTVAIKEVAGPSWKKALSGSGPGRFPGLVEFFFVVFLPSQLPRTVGARPTSGQSPGITLFSTENNDCKIHFKEESPMQRMRRPDGARGNTPATKITKTILRNPPIAHDPSLSVARKRAGFLGWSKGLMSTQIHRTSTRTGISGRRDVALKELN